MEQFPVHEILAELKGVLSDAPVVLLTAPPGAGKSTILPLELRNLPVLQGQKIIMLQPRRLAARSVAGRMAELLGDSVGSTVGYRVRFDSKVSAETQIEVVTEGILTRMLQDDPSLEGVGMVIFDEFHERSLNADLAWVLCKQAQDILREDLKILVMSATLDTQTLAAALGGAPVVSSEGRQYPVEIRYLPQPADLRMEGQVARAVRTALREEQGDLLVFLPGMGEIRRVQEMLESSDISAKVYPLYGNLPLGEQRAAILPDPTGNRKIVLATSIAETSLTIEGIGVVIDSGLSRRPRFDAGSGLTRLETVEVTKDAADQRAGRAGRLGPGICYRLWEEGKQHHLIPHRQPEILQSDLTQTLLELAQWGITDLSELNWPTIPPEYAVTNARELLEGLQAIEEGKITETGQEILRLPTHPRLGHMLAEGNKTGLGALAADIAALLEERDPLSYEKGADLRLRLDALHRWRQKERVNADTNVLRRVDQLARHWRRLLRVKNPAQSYDFMAPGRLISLAYPGRVARQLGKHQPVFRLSNGRRARLPQTESLVMEEWLAIAHMDAGVQEGRIYLAAPVSPEDLAELHNEIDILEWDDKSGELIARTEQRVGTLAYSTQALKDIPQEKSVAILLDAIRQNPDLLSFSEEFERWQSRILSLRAWRPEENWPDVSREGLVHSLEDWLAPFIGNIRRKDDFKKLDLLKYAVALLPWELASQLDKLAPTHLEVPSGSHIRLQYQPDGSPPVLAVKLQEMFGCLETPTVNGGKTQVMVHLLSPAQRPMQITQDLQHFWKNTYADVRKDMRGRYSKHYWPEDPFTATATRKVRPDK